MSVYFAGDSSSMGTSMHTSHFKQKYQAIFIPHWTCCLNLAEEDESCLVPQTGLTVMLLPLPVISPYYLSNTTRFSCLSDCVLLTYLIFVFADWSLVVEGACTCWRARVIVCRTLTLLDFRVCRSIAGSGGCVRLLAWLVCSHDGMHHIKFAWWHANTLCVFWSSAISVFANFRWRTLKVKYQWHVEYEVKSQSHRKTNKGKIARFQVGYLAPEPKSI